LSKYLFIISITLTLSGSIFGQRPGSSSFPGQNTQTQTSPNDTSTQRNSFLDIFTGKPGKAAFYSLIIPGGGQFYNRRYWKVPLIVGGEAAAFWWLFRNSSKYNEWQTAYLQLLKGERDNYLGVTDSGRAKIIRDGFLKQKEYAYIIVLLAHLFNVFEAFIDRHLIDFDVSDDLSYIPKINPSLSSTLPVGLTLSWSLNSNKKKHLKINNFFGTMDN
jgi:hypothetical protein